MEDIQILNEERKLYLIGPKKKRLELEMLSISKYYDEFVPEFLVFLNFFHADSEKLKLPAGKAWGRKKALTTVSAQLRRVFSYQKIRERFYRLLKKVGYVRFSRKYFMENVTPAMMVDIFLRVYKFNIDDFKKKLLVAADSILGPTQQSPIFTDLSSTAVGSKLPTGARSSSDLSRKKLKPRFRVLKK